MKSKSYQFIALILALAMLSMVWEPVSGAPDAQGEIHNCRFWGIISQATPAAVIQDHLVNLPNSIKNLGDSRNPDGWAVGYYPDGNPDPTANRGFPQASSDPNFNLAATEAANATPRIAVAHVRNTSAGVTPPSGDPHPFERVKDGRHWLMGHNGTIDKNVLLDLIRPDYFAANPPQYGSNQSEWIDSDLYQIFVLQTLEDLNFQVKPALGYVIRRLREEVGPGTSPSTEQFNFFLTDGTTLWAYREGNSTHTLYYLYVTTGTPYSAVASQYPSASQGSWVGMANGELITMRQDSPPVVENIETYFGNGLLVDNYFDDSADSAALRANGAGQDWYESRGLETGLLTLDETLVSGNGSKKAAFEASATGNAYVSQEFGTAQGGVFAVQWNVYVDEILDITGDPDRAGWMLIGDNTDPTRTGPNSDDPERFVYMSFLRDGGGTTGTMDLVARDRDDGWTTFTTIASGLNLDQWYTIRVVCDIPGGSYDVYVDDVLQSTVSSRHEKTSVTHISFAQWNDGAGAFYVDNVYQVGTGAGHTLTMAVDPVGGGTTDPTIGVHTYPEDEVVAITATPNAGYEFDHWTGDVADPNVASTTVTMDGDKTVTAHFVLLPVICDLTMAVDPAGGGTTTPAVGVHTYPEDEVVAITATPNAGYEFDHWTGAVADPNVASTTVTMDGNRAVIAHFVPAGEPTCVTIQRGTLGEVADGFIWQSRPTEGNFGATDFRSGFWNTGETRALVRFGLDVVPEDALVQSATLGLDQRSPSTGETVHVHRITAAWSEGGPTWASFASRYDAFTWASFVSVGGGITADVTDLVAAWVSGSQPNYGMMLINSPTSAVDRYISSEYSGVSRRPWLEVCYVEGVNYTLTMAADPAGGGTTTPAVGVHTYPEDEVVTISATPNAGYEFDHWAGDVADPNVASTTVTMDGDKTVTAHFALAPTVFLADNDFNASADGADLRTNGPGQDWYESRGDVPTLLFLDQTTVGGNGTKKAGFTASATNNAYVSQEFGTPQTGLFAVQWNIYVNEILNITGDPDRAGWMLIGDNTDPTRTGPNSDDSERFVYMGFLRDGGGTTGTMDLVARDRDDGWTAFTTIASGLNLDQWYTIRVVCDIPGGSYDVYVDDVFQSTVSSRHEKTSVTHISFAQWDDGAGAFYVDNVYQVGTGAGHTLIMAVDPVGGGTTDPAIGVHTYPEDEVVAITATPNAGYEFDHWTGDVADPNVASTTVTMDGDKTVTAHFSLLPVTYELTMAVDPAGGGTTNPAVGVHPYEEGAVVTISATPNAGYEFDHWTGDVADPNSASTTVTMDGDKTVTAHFVLLPVTYDLTMAVDPAGSGATDPAAGVHTYSEGEVVAITATPNAGYEFDHWTGAVADPNAASTTVMMDGNKTITAHFVPTGVPTCVTIQRGTLGEVADGFIWQARPAEGNFGAADFRSGLWNTGETRALVRFGLDVVPEDAVVQSATLGLDQRSPSTGETVHVHRITAAWSEGGPTWTSFASRYDGYTWASFVSVGGAITVDVTDLVAAWVSGSQPNYGMMLINSPTSAVDRYISSEYSSVSRRPWLEVCYVEAVNYSLTMAADPAGGGTTDPAVGVHTYPEDEVVAITATPNAGYEFDHWTGDVADPNAASTTVTMDGDKTVTAHFSLIPVTYELTMAVDPTAGGTTDPAVGVHTYPEDEVVAISATPNAGYEFDHWTGDVADPNAASTTVTMDGDKTVTAHFSVLVTPLLADTDFDASTDSADLRANSPGQDWYESRADVPGLLTLHTGTVGDNGSKKARLDNYGVAGNAYLTQDFNEAQSGLFVVSMDVYVDRIEDRTNYDRTGHIYIGYEDAGGSGPNSTSNERFVFMAFYDSTPGTSGNDVVLKARTSSAQAYATTSQWTTVATGLSYDTWHTIKIECDVASRTYDVYVDDLLTGNDIPAYSGYASSSVTHISFVADSDGRGTFYVDNVGTMYTLIMAADPAEGGTTEPPVGAHVYSEGQVIAITATPSVGYEFDHWTGDVAGPTRRVRRW